MSLHSVLYVFLSSLISLFPVLNPIGDGLVVSAYLKGLTYERRKKAAKKIFIYCILISIGSLLLGHIILLMFGLAVPVIQVGGGLIICKTGYDMLVSRDAPEDKPPREEVKKIDEDALDMKLFYPISFPIAVDPGTISVIFTLMATASVKEDLTSTVIHYAAIAMALILLTWLLCLFVVQGPRVIKKLGNSADMILNKFVAFLTFCIGIQIFVMGISKVFHIAVL